MDLAMRLGLIHSLPSFHSKVIEFPFNKIKCPLFVKSLYPLLVVKKGTDSNLFTFVTQLSRFLCTLLYFQKTQGKQMLSQ